jgi:hypothetical protein
MFRRYWRDPHFWRWLWHDRVSVELKALAAVVAAVLVLGVGWFTADRLASARAEPAPPAFVTTVEKIVTLHSAGRAFRKLVPEVRRTIVTRTTTSTSVETVRGGVRTVRGKSVVVRVPGAPGKVTTVAGPTKTVVTSKLVPTTDVQTHTSTLTQVQTQTQVQTRTSTVATTVTRTITQPVTTTQVVTVTQTVTQTTTTPPVTVTVTQPILTVNL